MLGTVYVDFDGTIAPTDPTDTVFDRFCDRSWRDIEREWQQGLRTARDCMARQVDLLRATPEALDGLLSTFAIDAHFPRFVGLCRRWRLEVVVVSDGMDRVVRHVLRAAGLDLPFFANRLQWLGGDRWKLVFPHARGDCAGELGNCKCGHRQQVGRGSIGIAVGDGRSDFCLARRSQLVLAKGQLAAQCLAENIPHWPIADFSEAVGVLNDWLTRHARKSA
ncbi:MAG TPA: HAD-IB family phosphatase [Hyphomicrobiaceae bacterium]|jgi:2,3-diketo-5-methylthio-1-phosphopentane phosphatase